jgi:hypothetical protein
MYDRICWTYIPGIVKRSLYYHIVCNFTKNNKIEELVHMSDKKQKLR